MAGRRIEIHPAALAELKSAVEWYLERSEPAAQEFVAAVDHAIALVNRVHQDVGRPGARYPQIRFAAIPLRGHLPGEGFGRANAGIRSWTPALWILEGTAVADKSRSAWPAMVKRNRRARAHPP